jgi:hypothetical protein
MRRRWCAPTSCRPRCGSNRADLPPLLHEDPMLELSVIKSSQEERQDLLHATPPATPVRRKPARHRMAEDAAAVSPGDIMQPRPPSAIATKVDEEEKLDEQTAGAFSIASFYLSALVEKGLFTMREIAGRARRCGGRPMSEHEALARFHYGCAALHHKVEIRRLWRSRCMMHAQRSPSTGGTLLEAPACSDGATRQSSI